MSARIQPSAPTLSTWWWGPFWADWPSSSSSSSPFTNVARKRLSEVLSHPSHTMNKCSMSKLNVAGCDQSSWTDINSLSGKTAITNENGNIITASGSPLPYHHKIHGGHSTIYPVQHQPLFVDHSNCQQVHHHSFYQKWFQCSVIHDGMLRCADAVWRQGRHSRDVILRRNAAPMWGEGFTEASLHHRRLTGAQHFTSAAARRKKRPVP